MKNTVLLDLASSKCGLSMAAIPLSFCKPQKTYLLERAGIPMTGTAILFTVPYLMTADVAAPRRNLSLYAVPRDYHGYMKELGDSLLPCLREAFPHRTFILCADHSPIEEVDAAARAGLGLVGLNGLLITPAYGSFVFIGEILTDMTYGEVTGHAPEGIPETPPACRGCTRCLGGCPAACIAKGREGCLSSLTQKKGALTESESEALAAHPLVWGCDTCQTLCPYNREVIDEGRDTPVPYFREHRLLRLDTAALDAMTEDEFASRAYAWRGRAVIRRNLTLYEASPRGKERRGP